MGGATPGQVVLGSIRKQDEKVMWNKLVSSTPPMASALAPSLSSRPDFLQ